jgi:hypothetical protein
MIGCSSLKQYPLLGLEMFQLVVLALFISVLRKPSWTPAE